MTFGCSPYCRQRFYIEFWHGLALRLTSQKWKEQRQLQLTVACSWAFSLEPCVCQASITVHNMIPRTFPQTNLGKRAIRVVSTLVFRHLCSVLSQPMYCTLCLTDKWKDGKRERSPVFWNTSSLEWTSESCHCQSNCTLSSVLSLLIEVYARVLQVTDELSLSSVR